MQAIHFGYCARGNGQLFRRKAMHYRLGSSLAALAIAAAAMLFASEARGATYTASNEAELRAAIDAANADGDPDSTITLTNNITLADNTALPALTKPLTIYTDGFTLSGQNVAAGNAAGGSIAFPASATSLTIGSESFLRGGDVAPNTVGTIGGDGLLGESLTLTNNGSITGGRGGANFGFGGEGVQLLNGTLINNGVITGGESPLIQHGFGGIGAALAGGDDHVNNGIIQGGVSPLPGFGGAGLALSENATLTNNGEILGGGESPGVALRGGSTIINSSTGQIDSVRVAGGNNTIINFGTIFDPVLSPIVIDLGSNIDTTTIINFGTLRSPLGTDGSRVAVINFGQTVVLEMHPGSVIVGNVWTDQNGLNTGDTLRLGGEGNDTFDVSLIDFVVRFTDPDGGVDPTAQYQSFDIFQKTGSSIWTIIGQGTKQDAPWDIYQGTMLMSDGSDLGNGAVDVFGGTLAGFGTVGPTTNHGPAILVDPITNQQVQYPGGTIAPGDDRLGFAGLGTLLIDGSYTSTGGHLAVVTVLGDDNSPTDVLAINGGTVGTTSVRVTNLGGTGAQTQNGIKIVDFDADETGNDSSDGTFSLLGDVVVNGRQAVIGGAYAYSLFQGTPTVEDGDWYLRSIGFSPTVPIYESYPGILLGLIDMPTFQQRVGNVYMPSAGSTTDGFVNPEPVADIVAPEEPPPANFWTRIEAAYGHYEGDSDTDTEYDLARYLVQVGIDGRLSESDDGILIGGINVQYGHADADIDSDVGDGDNSTDSYGGGLTLSWVAISGFYADAQAMVHYLESDLSSDDVGDLVDNNEGWGYGLSLELGRKLSLDDAMSLTPQAQLMYRSVDFDDFTDKFGADVSLEEGESLKGRLGVALGFDGEDGGESRSHVYGIVNLTYEFLDGQSVDIAGTDVEFEPEAFGGELGLGGTYEWAGGKYAIHGEALGQTSFEGGSYGVKGTAGFSTKF